MRFSTKSFTTDWPSLDVGIPMGCAISSLLFVLVMGMVIQESESVINGVELGPGMSLLLLRAFMDDITIVASKAEEVEEVCVDWNT